MLSPLNLAPLFTEGRGAASLLAFDAVSDIVSVALTFGWVSFNFHALAVVRKKQENILFCMNEWILQNSKLLQQQLSFHGRLLVTKWKRNTATQQRLLHRLHPSNIFTVCWKVNMWPYIDAAIVSLFSICEWRFLECQLLDHRSFFGSLTKTGGDKWCQKPDILATGE